MKSILEFSHYKDFLNAHVEKMRNEKSSWSLGSWSMALGLGGTASISRILSGERIPGDDIIEKLNRYFNFSDEEIKYFSFLVSREKYYSAGIFPKKPELISRNANVVSIFGVIDPEKAGNYLAEFDLEPILVENCAIGSVDLVFYNNTNIGPFNESHASLACRPKKGGILDTGLFMGGFTFESEELGKNLKKKWGHRYILNSLTLKKSEEKLVITAGEDQTPYISIDLNERSGTRTQDRYDMSSYILGENSVTKAMFTIDSIGREFILDSKKDLIDLNANPHPYSILLPLEFKPIKLNVHENLFSLIYPPERDSRMSY